MFRKSTISDKYGWWMGQNFCHPAGNFRHLLRTGEKWCNDLLLGGEAPSKLRLRRRGSPANQNMIVLESERIVESIRLAKRWTTHINSSRIRSTMILIQHCYTLIFVKVLMLDSMMPANLTEHAHLKYLKTTLKKCLKSKELWEQILLNRWGFNGIRVWCWWNHNPRYWGYRGVVIDM